MLTGLGGGGISLLDLPNHDEGAAERPPRKKKRKRKRKRKSPEQEAAAPSDASSPTGDAAPKPGRARYLWVVLLGIGLLEVWLFGRRGHVEVCVAKEGVHDFALIGQKRTDANTRQYPTCDKRLNLGITSSYEDAVKDAELHACHRANILRGKEATLICAIEQEGWQHRLTEQHCPPWHDHYYKRMFWFLQG